MKEIICIVCPSGCSLNVYKGENNNWIVKGNKCPKGKDFAINEMTNPTRTICTTVKTSIKDFPRVPVRTDGEIPKKYIFPLMKLINDIEINEPLDIGTVVLKDIFNTGVNVITTANIDSTLGDDKNE